MTLYNVQLEDGQTFQMSADMVQAAAGISANFLGEDYWQPTPYQTADACHDERRAAKLCAEYFRSSSDDCIEIDTVESVCEETNDRR